MTAGKARLLLAGLALCGAGALGGATQAQAQAQAPAPADAPGSAVVAQPQAAAAQTDSIDQQIAAWTQAPGRTDGADKADPNAVAGPRQIHGEAGVSFGNHGYRSGYVDADIPIGRDSDLGVGVGESQFKFKNGPTVTNKSLALSLRIGGDGRPSGPVDCRSETVRTDGRYLEPLWVSHLHGEALARDQADCAAPASPAAARAAE